MKLKHLLLLTLLLLAAPLPAQPLRLEGDPLRLPESWSVRYDPPEVLIRAAVQPDSLIVMIRVVDGKDRLFPLIVDYLAHRKLPAEFFPADASRELDLIIALEQSSRPRVVLDEAASPPPQIDLTEVEAWIRRDRQARSFAHPLRDPGSPDLEAIGPEPYRAGYFFGGRSVSAERTTLYRFRQYSTAFAPLLYEGFYHSLWDPPPHGNYATDSYPHPISVSDLQVGLGDYEHRFARAALKKNQLFGIDSLALDFGVIAQNGVWEDRVSAQTAMKYWLSLPFWNTALQLEFADFASDLSSVQLRPEYWQNTLYTIDHRYRQIYAGWQTPVLDLALRNLHETARAASFAAPLEFDALQFQAARSLSFGGFTLAGLYQHDFGKSGRLWSSQSQEDLASVDLGFRHPRLQAQAGLEAHDFESYRYDAELTLPLAHISFAAFANGWLQEPAALTRVEDIYTQNAWLPRVDLLRKNDLGLRLGLRSEAIGAVNLTLGQKRMLSATDPIANAFINDDNLPYANLSASFQPSFGTWVLRWQPDLTWQANAANVPGEAALEYHSHLNLTRELPYANAIFAGFSLHGHTEYSSPTVPSRPIGISAIADAWAGVRITNRFELTVTAKNVSDGNLYGIYPIPRSIHASLRWFYLN